MTQPSPEATWPSVTRAPEAVPVVPRSLASLQLEHALQERDLILLALKGRTFERAAGVLGIPLRTLYYKMKKVRQLQRVL